MVHICSGGANATHNGLK